MGKNTGISAKDLIETLREAKVINTDVSLNDALNALTSIESLSADDPVEGWCGTIRRPWLFIRTPLWSVGEQIVELNQSITQLAEVVRGLRAKST
jgi:hypothetical protein